MKQLVTTAVWTAEVSEKDWEELEQLKAQFKQDNPDSDPDKVIHEEVKARLLKAIPIEGDATFELCIDLIERMDG